MSIVKDIESRTREMCTHILFDYNGRPCGIDPLSSTEIDMWYGTDYYTALSFDDVMTYPLFDGKSINEIADKLKNLEL